MTTFLTFVFVDWHVFVLFCSALSAAGNIVGNMAALLRFSRIRSRLYMEMADGASGLFLVLAHGHA